jgi:hypothetical protein
MHFQLQTGVVLQNAEDQHLQDNEDGLLGEVEALAKVIIKTVVQSLRFEHQRDSPVFHEDSMKLLIQNK